MEQSSLRGERRLIPRLAAIAFDRIEKRRLFAANIRPGPAPQFDIELERRAEDAPTKKSVRPRRLGRQRQSLSRQRILPTYVDKTLLRADGKRRDGHPLQNREWIPFHQNAVFERARLRFIRIANEVVRPPRASLL